ncbi:hypothetical protein MNBD_UNCLBAC01-1666, partial [hydrothermal vent metagenome]
TLSHGYPVSNFPKHFVKRQQYKRLANLRRFCASFDSFCQRFISQRRLWRRLKEYCLCFGCKHNRFMPFGISLGAVPQKQSWNQITYATFLSTNSSQKDLSFPPSSVMDTSTSYARYAGIFTPRPTQRQTLPAALDVKKTLTPST